MGTAPSILLAVGRERREVCGYLCWQRRRWPLTRVSYRPLFRTQKESGPSEGAVCVYLAEGGRKQGNIGKPRGRNKQGRKKIDKMKAFHIKKLIRFCCKTCEQQLLTADLVGLIILTCINFWLVNTLPFIHYWQEICPTWRQICYLLLKANLLSTADSKWFTSESKFAIYCW